MEVDGEGGGNKADEDDNDDILGLGEDDEDIARL